jgi:hypothetical protein
VAEAIVTEDDIAIRSVLKRFTTASASRGKLSSPHLNMAVLWTDEDSRPT